MQNYHLISITRVLLGVVGLPVAFGECLHVGPLFVVLVKVTYSQEGSQHH